MATKTDNSPNSDTITRHDSAQPPRYQVIMHNDDYTTMEFVIEVLQTIFRKNPADATHVMLTIHTQGQAVCGNYPYEVAETKVAQAHQRASAAGYPLRCSMNSI